MEIDKIVHENRNSLLKTSDGKHNLMEKWGNMEKEGITEFQNLNNTIVVA
jgi:hypothetical protein